MAPKASIIIHTTELGNPYPPLERGMEAVRLTKGGDGKGCPKKRMPAGNGQDRGSYLGPKGHPRGTGVSQQRREVRQEAISGIAVKSAVLSVWEVPTMACVPGNGGV